MIYKPLQELIEVAVSDMFVDTYLVGDVRQRIFELRVREANRPLDLQACVNDVRKPIEELFTTAASDGQATLGLRLNQELQGARQAILKEAGESRDRVVRQLGKMEEGAPRDAFSAAQEHITTGHERFVREVDLQFTAISSQLKEVVQIYGERTWQEQSSSPAPTQNAS